VRELFQEGVAINSVFNLGDHRVDHEEVHRHQLLGSLVSKVCRERVVPKLERVI
jgi:hypothetical protein